MHHKKAKAHLEKALTHMDKIHEAEAGRKSNKSLKHRKAEARGMRKAMHDK